MTDSEQLASIIGEANDTLIEALGYVNAVQLMASSLGDAVKGKDIRDGVHSIQLIAARATECINQARNRLDDADFVGPVDRSNSGEN